MFKTIRQTAALGITTENHIRRMVATGECPGVMVGNRFMVNVDALKRILEAKSLEVVKQ